MKKVITGVLALSLMASPCFAESKAFTRPAGAVIGAGAAYAAGTYLAIPVGSSLVATPLGAEAAASFGLTAQQGVVEVAARGLVPQALDAGLVTYAKNTPDALLGVSTATLITSAAVGLGAYIIWQAITGDLQPPTVTLVQEGHTAPSGKAYRY